MPNKPAADATTMLDQVAEAIAKADSANMRDEAARYRQRGLAALTKPTDAMIDAAHEAVWSDGFWAISSRRDFQKAVRAMILAATVDRVASAAFPGILGPCQIAHTEPWMN